MSEPIILVDELPEGCNKCEFGQNIYPNCVDRQNHSHCTWAELDWPLDHPPLVRHADCPLRLRSRYVELPEGWEMDDSESPKATLTMMISENFGPSSVEGAAFVRRIDKEGGR